MRTTRDRPKGIRTGALRERGAGFGPGAGPESRSAPPGRTPPFRPKPPSRQYRKRRKKRRTPPFRPNAANGPRGDDPGCRRSAHRRGRGADLDRALRRRQRRLPRGEPRPGRAGAGGLEAALMAALSRLLELFEGPEAPGAWTPPAMPAALHALLPWRAFDESSELYVNAGSAGFVLELPPFAGIDAETLGRALRHARRRRARALHDPGDPLGEPEVRRRVTVLGRAARRRRGDIGAHGEGPRRAAWHQRLAPAARGRAALHAGGLPGVRHRLPRGRVGPGRGDRARRLPPRARRHAGVRRGAGPPPGAGRAAVAGGGADRADIGGYRDGGTERPPRRWAPRDPLHEQCIAPGRALSVHPTGLAFHHPDGSDIAVRVLSPSPSPRSGRAGAATR